MTKSFLKKSEDTQIGAERVEEAQKSLPVVDEKRGVVFVNGSKYRRAKTVLDLITGDKVAQKLEEQERKEHYIKQLAKNEIDVNDTDALPAIYEIMGGLIRTLAEQEQADRDTKEAQSKGKKDVLGLKE